MVIEPFQRLIWKMSILLDSGVLKDGSEWLLPTSYPLSKVTSRAFHIVSTNEKSIADDITWYDMIWHDITGCFLIMLSRKGQPRNGLQPPTLRLPMGQPQPARTTAAHREVKYSATSHQSWRYSTIDGALGRKKWINPATLVLHLSSFWKMKISWHIEPIVGGLEGRFFRGQQSQ